MRSQAGVADQGADAAGDAHGERAAENVARMVAGTRGAPPRAASTTAMVAGSHIRQSFRRAERLQHDQQREPDRVGKQRLVLGAGPLGGVDDRLWEVRAGRPGPVPEEVWDEAARHYSEPQLAALVVSNATINAWNRLMAATRQVSGEWVAQIVELTTTEIVSGGVPKCSGPG